MPYELLWMPKALDSLKGLDNENIKGITRKLEEAREFPRHFCSKLTNSPASTVRIGDYRIYARVKEAEKIIEVVYVEHRKKAYKP
ncbi:MAG: type II toxin-antitoxin system RelE/ParE family toxin [Candidatus Burarchaeum sp.]|nr:type II toxin-antitoxin system RelE/ParE family toxin [Candidatus Burarchaeum sp.]